MTGFFVRLLISLSRYRVLDITAVIAMSGGVGHLTRYGDYHGEIGRSDEIAGRGVGGCNHSPRRGLRPGLQKLVCAANNASHSTAYAHKKRIEELGPWEQLSTRPRSAV